MAKEKILVNYCGIPAMQFVGGKCASCSSVCDMTDQSLIDKRAYDFADRQGLLSFGTFHPLSILDTLEKCELDGRKIKCPKYFLDALAHDGYTFASLNDFPRGETLRVCRSSQDGTFHIGDVVWRDETPSGGLDGINFLRERACLDAEDCFEALKGAHFEISMFRLPEGRS